MGYSINVDDTITLKTDIRYDCTKNGEALTAEDFIVIIKNANVNMQEPITGSGEFVAPDKDNKSNGSISKSITFKEPGRYSLCLAIKDSNGYFKIIECENISVSNEETIYNTAELKNNIIKDVLSD